MKDWQVRAIKTFIQSFLGIAIPELCAVLSGTLPSTWTDWKAILLPILCSGLSAGISAVWNIYQSGNN
jgi:hypothetical protein